MPRKTKPRWNEHGISEVPDFALSDRQARDAADILGIAQQADIEKLAAELNEIGCLYLRWTAQDELGPSRAERNAALKEVLETSRRLELQLKGLDHASEGNLIDALPPYRVKLPEYAEDGTVSAKTEWQEFGVRQIQALRDRLTHFNIAAAELLRRQTRRGGPDRNKTLPEIIGYLAEIYERETGEPVTHNPYARIADYKGEPLSQAGRFMAKFLAAVDPALRATSLSTELARFVKRSKRRDKTKV